MIFYITSSLPTNLTRIIPLNIVLPILSVGTDLNVTTIPYPCTILSASVFVKTLSIGTFALNLTNGVGGTLASVSLTSAGVSNCTVSIPTLAANDKIRVNISSISTVLTSVNLTIWLALT